LDRERAYEIEQVTDLHTRVMPQCTDNVRVGSMLSRKSDFLAAEAAG
jgi:hypothetical protein